MRRAAITLGMNRNEVLRSPHPAKFEIPVCTVCRNRNRAQDPWRAGTPRGYELLRAPFPRGRENRGGQADVIADSAMQTCAYPVLPDHLLGDAAYFWPNLNTTPAE